MFKIKIVQSWFSNDYVSFKYTSNGIFWHYIKAYSRDGVGEGIYDMYSFKRISYRLNINKSLKEQFAYELDQWSSIEKINQFHLEQIEKMNKLNANLLKQQKEYEEKKKKVLSGL